MDQPQPARARDRPLRLLVQQHPTTRIPRRPATPRSGGTLRCENEANETGSLKIGNLQTPSPSNPGRLNTDKDLSRAYEFDHRVHRLQLVHGVGQLLEAEQDAVREGVHGPVWFAGSLDATSPPKNHTRDEDESRQP